MTSNVNSFAGCTMVGDYLDEGVTPENLEIQQSEVVRPRVVASYLDHGGGDDALKDFTILLRVSGARDDVQTIKVRGYRLQRVGPKGEGEWSWLGILAERGDKDVYAALFPGNSIIAAFCGEVQLADPRPTS